MSRPSTCPYCGALHTNNLNVTDHVVDPPPGSFGLCINCGEWQVFTEDSTRKPTDEEYVEIAANPMARELREIWVEKLMPKLGEMVYQQNGVVWEALVEPEPDLGYLPDFLNINDPRGAREQFQSKYIYGGWQPQSGWVYNPVTRYIKYPGDPVEPPLAMAKLRDETVILYRHDWVNVVQPDGSFEIARLS